MKIRKRRSEIKPAIFVPLYQCSQIPPFQAVPVFFLGQSAHHQTGTWLLRNRNLRMLSRAVPSVVYARGEKFLKEALVTYFKFIFSFFYSFFLKRYRKHLTLKTVYSLWLFLCSADWTFILMALMF